MELLAPATSIITGVSVSFFRGIITGELEDLKGLTLLTGPNGCGKSSILDALLIATSPKPHEAVGRAVKRHSTTRNGARWLIGVPRHLAADADFPATSIHVIDASHGTLNECHLQWSADSDAGSSKLKGDPPYSEITTYDQFQAKQSVTAFAADNSYVAVQKAKGPLKEVRLVDLVNPEPLDLTYSEAVKQGRKKEVLALLADVVPGLEGLDILTEVDRKPALYVVTGDKAVPAGLSGGGIQALLQLAVGLDASPGGLVLVEEPEVFQHPRSIRQGAKALLAAMRRGVQLVVTTHSLELIDAVVGQASAEDLEQVVLFNLALSDGELKSSRLPGPQVELARNTLEKELR